MSDKSVNKTAWLLEAKQKGEKIASLTCYDYPTARLLDEGGVRLLLVGDSLGMVVLGYEDTTRVTLADMVHHTRAVARGAAVRGRATVVADLPYKSYETAEHAVTAAKALQAAGAHAVKLEGGRAFLPQIEAILKAGIPFVGHLGMLPQSVKEEGGYHVKGKTDDEAARIEDDAKALAVAGASAIVLELVVPAVAERITRAIPVPTIGIGSGDQCDGQILVVHDYLGLFPWFRPKFVRPDPEAELGPVLRESARRFVRRTGAPDWSEPTG
ncbi:ketopantoate hydroxymethyltransferase [Verrucomicrobium sp. GAS474]|uniref:3-methyl-2-oxobutanoate hydroxymethyltransferase n=1 Tax=Verrucomicrobium sp. GAS474 TaxID=1882831 RepID=UPI00087DBE65|nr:3-methyl-2-oxobutanoate hydroxymethyltransferase [Verrucomicrobium sp. GAS474]SDU14723.1 ketopantoate hydroxymethyltransferase [Verrucomicrobium sp. GAS474]